MIKCKECGEQFGRREAYKDHFKENHQKYKYPPPTLNPFVEIYCDYCGKKIERRLCLCHHPVQFCDNQCQGKYREKDGSRPNYYGKNWQEQRRKTLERDGHKCQKCGMDREKLEKWYKQDFHVHHKKPIREFDKPEKANKLENFKDGKRETVGQKIRGYASFERSIFLSKQ